MRLLRASLLKASKRPAGIRTLVVVGLILALVYLSIGTSVGAIATG